MKSDNVEQAKTLQSDKKGQLPNQNKRSNLADNAGGKESGGSGVGKKSSAGGAAEAGYTRSPM